MGRTGRKKIGEGRREFRELQLGIEYLFDILTFAVLDELLVNLRGREQGPCPFRAQGRKHQVGGRKVGGKMFGVGPALGEADDRTEGFALPKTDKGFVAELRRVVDVLGKQYPFYRDFLPSEIIDHPGAGVADKIEILMQDSDPPRIRLVGDSG